MLTLLIEIYDGNDLEKNIQQCHLTKANHILFVHRNHLNYTVQANLQKFIREYVNSVESVIFHKLDLHQITKELALLTKNYQKVIVDIDGGDSELVVALYRYAVQSGFDIFSVDEYSTKRLEWKDNDIVSDKVDYKPLTITQIIELHGGQVRSIRHSSETTIKFNESEKLMRRILTSTQTWGQIIQVFKTANYQGLSVKIPYTAVQQKKVREWLNYLEEANLIVKELNRIGNPCYTLTSLEACDFCRGKGYALELYLYLLARESQLFDECYMGVVIDWDDKVDMGGDVLNEIDLVLRQNDRYAFISCKMTKVQSNDLNELEVYTQKFVGKRCIKIIASTEPLSLPCLNRCREYGIHVLDRETLLDQFVVTIQKLFENQ